MTTYSRTAFDQAEQHIAGNLEHWHRSQGVNRSYEAEQVIIWSTVKRDLIELAHSEALADAANWYDVPAEWRYHCGYPTTAGICLWCDHDFRTEAHTAALDEREYRANRDEYLTVQRLNADRGIGNYPKMSLVKAAPSSYCKGDLDWRSDWVVTNTHLRNNHLPILAVVL